MGVSTQSTWGDKEISRSNKIKMVSHRTSEDSLSFFLGAFNQLLLITTFLAIVLSVGMEGLVNNSTGSEPLVEDDYNFEIKTAMERTKNHAAFMMGIVVLTFTAVLFVTVDWAVLKYRNPSRAALRGVYVN